MIKTLLRLAYDREIELEALIDRTNSQNKWFFEDTMQTNIEFQKACLDKIREQESTREYKRKTH